MRGPPSHRVLARGDPGSAPDSSRRRAMSFRAPRRSMFAEDEHDPGRCDRTSSARCSRPRSAGDEDAFRRLLEPHRTELHAHCYRMLGSVHDAEDALQDALLRAWRGLARFEGAQLAARLAVPHRDQRLPERDRAAARRVLPVALRPGERPARRRAAARRVDLARAVSGRPARARGRPRGARRRATSSARASSWRSSPRSSCFPPRQRAALIMREVLGFSAREVAESLGRRSPP